MYGLKDEVDAKRLENMYVEGDDEGKIREFAVKKDGGDDGGSE
jgi:hypothetical protein